MKNAGCATFVAYAVAGLLILAALTTLINEPGVALLLMLGGGAIIWVARRRSADSTRTREVPEDDQPTSIVTLTHTESAPDRGASPAAPARRTRSSRTRPPRVHHWGPRSNHGGGLKGGCRSKAHSLGPATFVGSSLDTRAGGLRTVQSGGMSE